MTMGCGGTYKDQFLLLGVFYVSPLPPAATPQGYQGTLAKLTSIHL